MCLESRQRVALGARMKYNAIYPFLPIISQLTSGPIFTIRQTTHCWFENYIFAVEQKTFTVVSGGHYFRRVQDCSY